MFWVIEENILDKEPRYRGLIDNLERFEQEYIIVKTLPFIHKLVDPKINLSDFEDVSEVPEMEIPDKGNIFPLGSVALDKIAKKRGWYPGSLSNENFDFNIWGNHRLSLNKDAEVVKFQQLELKERAFIRPVDDSKLFTGTIIEPEDFLEWKDNLIINNDDYILEQEIVVAPPKRIQRECRFFVFGEWIATGSQYKLGSRTVYDELYKDNKDPCWITASSLAHKISVDHFAPSKAYVMDLALHDGKYYLLEYNNMNSAGFYHCDIQKIVQGIMDLE